MTKNKNKNNSSSQAKSEKMYVVAVDMGYGHQRAAAPLAGASVNGVINANFYQGISRQEQYQWNESRTLYELISRFKDVPIIGPWVFRLMDYFQRIEPFYPRRDLSKPYSQLKFFYRKIKRGMGKNLIDILKKKPLPLVTTFFVPAYVAEYNNYPGKIYLVVTDADVARAWAPMEPRKSRIIYLAPNKRVRERLLLYGIKPANIYVTGFPLPKENIGGLEQKILKSDLKDRLAILDPKGIYRRKYSRLLEDYLCPIKNIKKPNRPLTITFAVGGAGAQREIGASIAKYLYPRIKKGEVHLNLVAGSRNDVYVFFQNAIKQCGLADSKNVDIIFSEDKQNYFKLFNKALRTTDILWTKPSELTFYSGLGLPILMTTPVGSQEFYNRDWLLAIGAGIDAPDVRYVNEWLFDWLNSGWLAEAAMQGYLDAPKMGTYHIENIVLHNKVKEIEDIQLM